MSAPNCEHLRGDDAVCRAVENRGLKCLECAYRAQFGAEVERLRTALTNIDNIVVQSEDVRDMYDDVREAVARALAGKTVKS